MNFSKSLCHTTSQLLAQTPSVLHKSLAIITSLSCAVLLASCGVNTDSTSKLHPAQAVSLTSNDHDITAIETPNKLAPVVISGKNYYPDTVVFGGSYSSTANGRVKDNSNQPISSTQSTNSHNKDQVVTTTTTYPDGVKITRVVTFHPISNAEYQQILNNPENHPDLKLSNHPNSSPSNSATNSNDDTATPVNSPNMNPADKTSETDDSYTQKVQACMSKYGVKAAGLEELQSLLTKCYPNTTVYNDDKAQLTSSQKLFPSSLGPQLYPYLIAPGNSNLFIDTFSFDVPRGFKAAKDNNPSYFNFQPKTLMPNAVAPTPESAATQPATKVATKAPTKNGAKAVATQANANNKINEARLALQNIESLDLYVNTNNYDNLDYQYLSAPVNRTDTLVYFNHTFTENNPGTDVTCSIFYNLPNDHATYIRCNANNPTQRYSYTYGIVALPKHERNLFFFSLNTTYRNTPNAATMNLVDGYADYIASHIQ